MPSAPRDFARGVHHVWVNATGNEPYYVDDIDRMAWIRQLVATCKRYGWTCIAFCQLTTHVHAILQTCDETLPLGMKQLNFGYSRHFNDNHARAGQLVRRRYSNRRVVDGKDLLGTYAYVVLNVVEAGLCPRAEDWRWSSYATTLGIANDFPFVDASLVLAELGCSRERLRKLVAARLEERLAASATSGV